MRQAALFASLAFLPLGLGPESAQQSAGPGTMTFFVTSVGPGKGADLGGLEGADRHCQSLAQAAGAGNRTWRAYLSTQGSALNDPKFVNARDRIGPGPWQNAKGRRDRQECRRTAFDKQQPHQRDSLGREGANP